MYGAAMTLGTALKVKFPLGMGQLVLNVTKFWRTSRWVQPAGGFSVSIRNMFFPYIQLHCCCTSIHLCKSQTNRYLTPEKGRCPVPCGKDTIAWTWSRDTWYLCIFIRNKIFVNLWFNRNELYYYPSSFQSIHWYYQTIRTFFLKDRILAGNIS